MPGAGFESTLPFKNQDSSSGALDDSAVWTSLNFTLKWNQFKTDLLFHLETKKQPKVHIAHAQTSRNWSYQTLCVLNI